VFHLRRRLRTRKSLALSGDTTHSGGMARSAPTIAQPLKLRYVVATHRSGQQEHVRQFKTETKAKYWIAEVKSLAQKTLATLDRMMDLWEEQIKSPDPMTASSAMLAKLKSLPSPRPWWRLAKRRCFPKGRDEPFAGVRPIHGAMAERVGRRDRIVGQAFIRGEIELLFASAPSASSANPISILRPQVRLVRLQNHYCEQHRRY
jgi:hypothetical protein